MEDNIEKTGLRFHKFFSQGISRKVLDGESNPMQTYGYKTACLRR